MTIGSRYQKKEGGGDHVSKDKHPSGYGMIWKVGGGGGDIRAGVRWGGGGEEEDK